MRILILVAIGGGIGSALRYLLGDLLNNQVIPYGTWMANILGSFLIGVLSYLLAADLIDKKYSYLLIIGFCGGFTTFSSFAYENFKFLQQGNLNSFLLYSFSSFTMALLAVYLGNLVGKLSF